MSQVPTVSQVAHILHVSGRVILDVPVNQPAMDGCRAAGWTEPIDVPPYARATPAGIEAARPLVSKAIRAHRINVIKKGVAKLTDDELSQVTAMIDRHRR